MIIKLSASVAGSKTVAGQHYRAEMMAFWLDLVPKLHRPDRTSTTTRFHQLDDAYNATTFERDGTLVVDYPDDDDFDENTIQFHSHGGSTSVGQDDDDFPLVHPIGWRTHLFIMTRLSIMFG